MSSNAFAPQNTTLSHPNSLRKAERISHRRLVEELFNSSKSKSLAAFPIRMVYLLSDKDTPKEPQARILVSVSKRHFKRAVKRNRVKRQLREAYRTNKNLILEGMKEMPTKTVAIALLWMDSNIHTTKEVEQRTKKLLIRLKEQICVKAKEPLQQ